MGRSVIQVSVLERFMTKEQLDKILVDYVANKKAGEKNRFNGFAIASTPEEEKVLTAYVTEKSKTIGQLAVEAGMSRNKFIAVVFKAAVRKAFVDSQK